MNIDVVAGARPNFMKVAALFAVASLYPDLSLRLIHTGQHYDFNMSEVFMHQLLLPPPTVHFNVGSASHAVQTADVMRKYEEWCLKDPPALCVVVGDVNSTAACSIVAAKLGIKVAHVEAGLRSFDKSMPEEINRILTDSISTIHFVSETSGIANLSREGHKQDTIHFVGQVMIDTLIRMLPHAPSIEVIQSNTIEFTSGYYSYVTLHRPSNVDNPRQLGAISAELIRLAHEIAVVFPLHPRTRKHLLEFGFLQQLELHPNIYLSDPVDYLTSLSLTRNAKFVVTDSGGLQEETTYLGIPCLTLRENTERPITITAGTNTLIGSNWVLFHAKVREIIEDRYVTSDTPIPYWDGRAGIRIMEAISEILQ